MQHFVVVPSGASATGEDLTLSQADIDSLLRSKAAMFAILTTITEMVNVSLWDIQRFYIGGASLDGTVEGVFRIQISIVIWRYWGPMYVNQQLIFFI